MPLVITRRRTSSSILLLAFGLVLAGATASALATPSHCCPETQSERTPGPVQPCASLVPAACCDAGATLQAGPVLSPPPATLLAFAPPPARSAAFARTAASRPAGQSAHAPFVLRL
jgi:hypothetical protein